MAIITKLRVCLVIGAMIGLLIPHPGLAAGPRDPATVQDIALRPDNSLSGVLTSEAGRLSAGTVVELVGNDELIARAVTGSDGRFRLANIQPGVYSVRAQGTERVYRLWSDDAAPPVAKPNLIFNMSTKPLVRGQGLLHGDWHRHLLIGGLLAAAGVIGGVIGYNIKDDAS